MINNFSLLFSVVAVFYVAIRAAFLDRSTPWFGSATAAEPGRKQP